MDTEQVVDVLMLLIDQAVAPGVASIDEAIDVYQTLADRCNDAAEIIRNEDSDAKDELPE